MILVGTSIVGCCHDTGMPTLPCVAATDVEALAQALREHGACRINELPVPAATIALRDELQRLQFQNTFAPGAIGQGGTHVHRADLRGDSTLWLDDPVCGVAARQFLMSLERLRIALERCLFMGLDEVEAHYAAYPIGTVYTRHRDRFRDADPRKRSIPRPSTRMLSLVSYLNDDWHATDGGALRLYLDAGAVDVLPVGGTSICFVSEFEHEVLPAARERLSVAAWFRRAG